MASNRTSTTPASELSSDRRTFEQWVNVIVRLIHPHLRQRLLLTRDQNFTYENTIEY